MLNVMCLTWNLELDLPDHAALEECFVNYINKMSPAAQPHVIVIGLQETMSYTRTGDGTFIGHKLAEEKLLGGMEFIDDPYHLIMTEHFKGMTKLRQVFTRKAQQVIQVLVRRSLKDKLLVSPISKTRSKTSEKGFIGVDMAMQGKHLNFISTHLDAKTEAKREADCERIAKELQELATHSKFHAMFLMGDLNFRLPAMKIAYDNDGRGSLQAVSDKFKPKASDQEMLYEYLLNRKGRKQLMAIDSFHASKVFDAMPYTWPTFPIDCLPTYKRKHKAKHYKLIPKLKDAFLEDGWLRKDIRDELLLKLYGGKGKFKYNTKRNCWDLGWLDRIGYAVKSEGQYNEKLGLHQLDDMLQNGVKVQEPNGGLKLEVFSHVPYGDHAPVACVFKLAGLGPQELVVVDDNVVELEQVEDSDDELDESDDDLHDSDDELEDEDEDDDDEDDDEDAFGFQNPPDSNFGIDQPKPNDPPSSFF